MTYFVKNNVLYAVEKDNKSILVVKNFDNENKKIKVIPNKKEYANFLRNF